MRTRLRLTRTAAVIGLPMITLIALGIMTGSQSSTAQEASTDADVPAFR